MINRCLIIFMELSFLGCAYKSNREIMNSWMGSHISAVIRSWGPPTQITSDGAGGKIYIRRPQPIQLPPEPPPAPPGASAAYKRQVAQEQLNATYRRIAVQTHNNSYKMFYVRPNGIVYHWRAR